MKKFLLPFNLCCAFVLIGCRSPEIRIPDHLRPDRGAAVQARYWAQQEAQKPPPRGDHFEHLPLPRPPLEEDGILHTATTTYLRVPHFP